MEAFEAGKVGNLVACHVVIQDGQPVHQIISHSFGLAYYIEHMESFLVDVDYFTIKTNIEMEMELGQDPEFELTTLFGMPELYQDQVTAAKNITNTTFSQAVKNETYEFYPILPKRLPVYDKSKKFKINTNPKTVFRKCKKNEPHMKDFSFIRGQMLVGKLHDDFDYVAACTEPTTLVFSSGLFYLPKKIKEHVEKWKADGRKSMRHIDVYGMDYEIEIMCDVAWVTCYGRIYESCNKNHSLGRKYYFEPMDHVEIRTTMNERLLKKLEEIGKHNIKKEAPPKEKNLENEEKSDEDSDEDMIEQNGLEMFKCSGAKGGGKTSAKNMYIASNMPFGIDKVAVTVRKYCGKIDL